MNLSYPIILNIAHSQVRTKNSSHASNTISFTERKSYMDICDWYAEESNKDPFFMLHQLFVDPYSRKASFHWFENVNGKIMIIILLYYL